MSPVDELLVRARAAGIVVHANVPRIVIKGPNGTEDIADELIEAKPGVLARLTADADPSRCHRCGIEGERLVPAYWSPSVRYCGACCSKLARELDVLDGWPAVPTSFFGEDV